MDFEYENNSLKEETGEQAKPEVADTNESTVNFTMGEVTSSESGAAPEPEKEEKQEKEENEEKEEKEEKKAKKEKKKKDKKSGSGFGKKLLLFGLCALIAGVAAGGAFFGLKKLTGDDQSVAPVINQDNSQSEEAQETPKTYEQVDQVQTNDYSSSASLDVSDLVEEALPSLVSITNVSVTDTQNYYYYFFNGGSTQQESVQLGSGVIVGQNETELLIVTNAHVIENASEITITFFDGESYSATTKGQDTDVDIAVVAVKLDDMQASSLESIKIAKFGDSDELKVGEQVVAIGNAEGKGQSVTTGIVSALDRVLSTSSSKLIQTDAAINPGNSGGALFNMKGEVIGINSSKYVSTDTEGMGFAIPSSTVSPLAQEFMNRETREKVSDDEAGYLGISCQDISEEMEAAYGIPQGIYISKIISGAAADNAGIPLNSVIVKFDGISVSTYSSLSDLLSYYKAGEKIEVICMVLENGTYVEKTYEVTLSAAKDYVTTDGQASVRRSRCLLDL